MLPAASVTLTMACWSIANSRRSVRARAWRKFSSMRLRPVTSVSMAMKPSSLPASSYSGEQTISTQ